MFEIWNVILNSVIITAFVAMMMLGIEYLNVSTEGLLIKTLLGSKWKAYAMGAILGITPGCLGAFAMVSLYAHRRVTLGAMVATMIATSGDEAFVMLSIFPVTAIAIFVGLAVLGVAAGWLTDSVFLKNHESKKLLDCNFHTHEHEVKEPLTIARVKEQWRHLSPVRGILMVSIAGFLVVMFGFKLGLINPNPGQRDKAAASAHDAHSSAEDKDDHQDHAEHDAHEENGEAALPPHDHVHGAGGWTWYTLVLLLGFGLFVIGTVTDHFLDDHLWGHVLKVHVPRIFLWTVGALASIELLNHFIDVHEMISNNLWVVLGLAIVIGLIPESGPHLVFVAAFASGALPLSILVASSIVQDGHGTVPLLAHSRKDFLLVKLLNAAIGLAVGASMLAGGV